MAKIAQVNIPVTNGPEAVWNLISLLINSGSWQKVQDSDGTTYSSSGSQVTGPGSGSNGLNNSEAWVALVDPGGERKYFFQRGSGSGGNQDRNWWIRYSRNAALGGTPNATTMPTTTDIQNVHGTSVTGSALFGATASYYTHAVAETTPSSGTYGVYQFWFACTAVTTGASLQGGLAVQGLDPTATSGLDQDPAVFAVGDSTANSIAKTSALRWWNYYGLGSPTPAWLTTGGRVNAPVAAAGPNPWSGEDVAFPTLYCLGGANTAPIKGQGIWLLMPTSARAYPDTINLSSDAYVYWVDTNTHRLLLPWPDGVVPQL